MGHGVSVVIPTYNRLGVLEKTLPSYLSPSVVSEVVIMDEVSSDATAAMVRDLAARWPGWNAHPSATSTWPWPRAIGGW